MNIVTSTYLRNSDPALRALPGLLFLERLQCFRVDLAAVFLAIMSSLPHYLAVVAARHLTSATGDLPASVGVSLVDVARFAIGSRTPAEIEVLS